MRTAPLAALALLSFAPTSLAAQSPVHSAQGDPTVRDDTIYALATDSAAYPELGVITLFDDGIVRIEEDGTSTVTYRVVRQVLRSEAVRGLSELELGYDAGHEVFTLNWTRVVDPDSGLVSDSLLHLEELDVTVSPDSPIFTDRKRVRLSWGGVAAGRILDYSYTVRDTAPLLAGDLWRAWNVNSTAQIRRSRYVVDLPEASKVRVREENLSGPTREVRADGRWIREWSYAELDRVEPEPFVADSNGVARTITTSGWLSWEDISRWYGDLARGRMSATPAIQAKLAELAPEGTPALEALRRAHRWVSQEVRYISLSLGMGGYQPRAPGEVLTSLSGDCKDKATLFVAMARALGFEAYPVLIRTAGKVDLDLPSIFQFNHMVAAVRLEGAWHLLDLTVPVSPFRELYGGLQGKTGILLTDEGGYQVLDLPKTPAEANRSHIQIAGALQADGTFQGTYTERVTGSLQYRMRSEFARTLNTQQMESLKRTLAGRTFPDAQADSIEIFDGRDLEAEPRLWARVTASGVLRAMGGGWILTLRIPRYQFRQIVDQLRQDTLRSFPLNAEAVFGLREHVTELRLTLPQGWTAELPPSVVVDGLFGRYEGSYALENGTLVVRRSLRGAEGTYPPERVPDLIAWFEGITKDDAEFILLREGSPPPPRF